MEGDSSWCVFAIWQLGPGGSPSAGRVRPASGGPITPRPGMSASDFTTSNPGVQVTILSVPARRSSPGPTGAPPASWSPAVESRTSGLNYNACTDTMYVGIQGYTERRRQGGDLRRRHRQSQRRARPESRISAATKSVAIAFAPISHNAAGQSGPARRSIIAGIPARQVERARHRSTDSRSRRTPPISRALPSTVSASSCPSSPAAWPSTRPRHIPTWNSRSTNFSKIPGLNASNGFYMQVLCRLGR